MGQAAPDVRHTRVRFDGEWYTVHWIVHGGCVMLLHPHLCRIGTPLHLGDVPERIAQMMIIRGLDHLRARGHLWMIASGAPFAFAYASNTGAPSVDAESAKRVDARGTDTHRADFRQDAPRRQQIDAGLGRAHRH